MVKSLNNPDYIFEEYNGYVIASHKNNIEERHIENLIIVYKKEDFPDYGFIIGLDDSKSNGQRKMEPNNLEDAKIYIDWLVKQDIKNSIYKNNNLPEIEICGSIYQFDIDRIVLVEKDNPNNKIFFSYMNDYGTHYEFLYNVNHKNYSHIGNLDIGDPFDGHLGIKEANNETVFQVSIPRISELDPKGMMSKYGCSLADLENLTDFEIIVDQEVYRRRMAGEMVKVDIGGQIYEVDVHNNALRSKDNPENDINLSWFYYDYFIDEEDSYYLYFNMETNQIVDLLYDQNVDNLLVYKVPMISDLDPLAFVHNGPMLFYYDLKMEHILKPVSQTIDIKSLLNKEFVLDRQELSTSIPIYENDQRFLWKEYKDHLIAEYKEGNLTVVYDKLKMSDDFKIVVPSLPESQQSVGNNSFGVQEAMKHIDNIVDKPPKNSKLDLKSKLLSQKEYLNLFHSRTPIGNNIKKTSIKRKGPKM
ncbi:hypothetical protein CEQ15_11390 [Chryseobacterium indologenes]|uniref:hypothetical protein n=1 Tax=Chryseobacterium indologenes TaxID=253 RepID=UPI000B51850E|nr:hypothetical protein [Chryseobacterium indologenes]ASE62052.1 hypothetical protein CEQ15_11390 [Chryseobacterium indologenes]